MIKKIIRLSTILLFLLPLTLSAQKQNFTGGALFSFNGIGLLGESAPFWNSPNKREGAGHGGITAGLFVKRSYSKTFYSLLQIRYSTKGSIYSYTNVGGLPGYESLHLSYFEVPFLMGYKLTGKKWNFYFESGFAYAKLIQSRIKVDDSNPRPETPDVNNIRTNDLLWIGSLKFPLRKKWEKNLLCGLSVSSSVLSIHPDYKLYNLCYSLEVNYFFDY